MLGDIVIRPITVADDVYVAQIIRSVMTEYDCVGEGYSIMDSAVDHMTATYAAPRAACYVVTMDGGVMGVAGIAQLAGASHSICELQKMYFMSSLRGYGAGNDLLHLCLETALSYGYTYCYLETVNRMVAANGLYRKHGFLPLDGPMGATGHGSCDRWYGRAL